MMWRLSDGIARFRALPAAERHALVQAATRYGVVMYLLRTIGLKGGLTFIQRAQRGIHSSNSRTSPIDVDQFVLAVGRAHKVWGRGTCLDRALTLCWLLQSAGLPAEVRLGVRKHDGDLDAHAWVDYKGKSLGDDGKRGVSYAAFEAVMP